MVTVEGERCETVDLDHLRSRNISQPSNPILRFFESNFGTDQHKKRTSLLDKEMDEFPTSASVKLVPTIRRETVAGFDICREYSYSGDEDENSYFVDSKPPTLTTGPSSLAADAAEEDVVKTHLLGRTYHPIRDFTSRRDYESSLFWFTYRCGFPEIMPYNITSDAGWGCMLRSAQMLLAQALRLHYKSRDWKPPHLVAKRRQDPFVRSMLSWFADFPSTAENLYSIHNMVATGLAKYDKLPGEWYGPGTVCYVLRDLVELHERQSTRSGSGGDESSRSSDRRMFRVHVAPQSSVYLDAIEELMTRDNRARQNGEKVQTGQGRCNQPTHPLDAAWEDELVESVDKKVDWDTALLLLIPLRLGLSSFNEAYVRGVAHTFSLPQSVGGLGGRPRSARWFYGALSDGSKIFGLDPHTVQNAARKRAALVNGKSSSVVDLTEDYLRSVHTTYPEVFCLQKMDPSIALGFYCRTRQDLESVFARVREWHAENRDSPELFSVMDAAPDYSADVSSAMDDMMMSRLAGSLLDVDDGQVSDEDEYVML
jgi:cysteine protease ATG4